MSSFDDIFFDGKRLYGDDSSLDEIQKWYKEEKEAYAVLVRERGHIYNYPCHSMNCYYGYRHINHVKRFPNALGLGSAFGHEFLPIIERIDNLTIVEPSKHLRSRKLGHLVPKYIEPNIDGSLDFLDDSFDLITCFGVLHHIPNVRFVLSELVRVLRPEGFLLLREPIRTMGDWRLPRLGLTKNERGIPYTYFNKFFESRNVKIIKKSFCDSNYAYRLLNRFIKINRDTYLYQAFDSLISRMFQWNIHYHPRSMFQKKAPASVFMLYRKMNRPLSPRCRAGHIR